jgi:hypothetical protein
MVIVASDHNYTDTLGRTTLDEGSACRREHYMAIHNTQKRPTSISPAEIEHAVPAN